MRIAPTLITSATTPWQATMACVKTRHLTFSNSLTGQVLLSRAKISVHREGFSVFAGRKAAKIANKKGKEDAKRSKLYGRFGKKIVMAVKQGGGDDPIANTMLRDILVEAKNASIPKDLIERNIARASSSDQSDYSEVTYEAYGPAGAGIIIEANTDNVNRANSFIRDVVKKNGGKMAEMGSVAFNFQRRGVLRVDKTAVEGKEEDVMMAVVDAGAEDVLNLEADDDSSDEDAVVVLTAPEDWNAVKESMQEQGIEILMESSGQEMIPVVYAEGQSDAEEELQNLIDKLLELDDVDAVYHNFQCV